MALQLNLSSCNPFEIRYDILQPIVDSYFGSVVSVVLTPASITALRFIAAYRYLTVAQVATVVGCKVKTVSSMLLKLERQHLLGAFGNVGMRGYGKTPKVYFLTKTGHRLLADEATHLGFAVSPFRQVNVTKRWSPMMYHRLAALDVMMALERDCAALQRYRLIKTFVEYRRERHGTRARGETTDYVRLPETSPNRIVPDAGFVLENIDSGKRALFFIEVDCGTERLTTAQPEAVSETFRHKITQYDWYYYGKRFAARYRPWGDFTTFKLLVITESAARIANMRRALGTDHIAYHQLYRFSTQADVLANALHDKWLSRDPNDHHQYPLIKGDHSP